MVQGIHLLRLPSFLQAFGNGQKGLCTSGKDAHRFAVGDEEIAGYAIHARADNGSTMPFQPFAGRTLDNTIIDRTNMKNSSRCTCKRWRQGVCRRTSSSWQIQSEWEAVHGMPGQHDGGGRTPRCRVTIRGNIFDSCTFHCARNRNGIVVQAYLRS